MMFDKNALDSYVKKYYPQYHNEIFDLRKWMNQLLIIAIGGLMLIIVIYLFMKFK